VRSAGGNVIRLAGLYTATRGPHAFWLHRSRDLNNSAAAVIQGAADSVVNLLHYQDAAAVVIALLQRPGTYKLLYPI
jgi:nucleoside-diphosphate-sugar epimerase